MIDNNNKESELKKVSENDQNSGSDSNSFFSKDNITNISQNGSRSKIDRNLILDFIRKNAPITKYEISKKLNIAYTTISLVCREFEFVGLIKSRVVIGENNRTHKELYMKEKNDT